MLRVFAWMGRNIGEAKVDPDTGGGAAAISAADRVYGKPLPRDDGR